MNGSLLKRGERVLSVDSVALWIIVALTFFLPLFFLPASSFHFQFTKSILIIFAVLLALAFFIVGRMKEQTVTLMRNPILLLSVWLLPLAYLLSALFSSSIALSLVGNSLNADTFGFMAIMAFLFTLTALIVRTRGDVLLFYLATVLSFAVLALYHLLRLFIGPDFLSFGMFTAPAANTVGTWNDLGIFFGLVTVLTMVTLAALTLERQFKILLYLSLAVSLFFLALINFGSVWWLVGFFALGTFVHSIASKRLKEYRPSAEGEVSKPIRNISFSSLVVLVIASIFIFSTVSANRELARNPNAENRGIHNYLSTSFKVTSIEARPNWQTTVNIARETMKENAVFGTGANTFVKQWLLHKPSEVNETIFWNFDFNAGIGVVPTSFITTGIVGGIAWVVFLGLLLYTGIRALIIRPSGDRFSYYLTLSSFLGSVYLWTLTVLYTTGVVLLAFAFLLSALFFASLKYRTQEASEERTFSFTENPRLGFVSVLILTVLFLGTIVSLFTLGQKYAAASFYQRALTEVNVNGNIDGAEANVNQALALGSDDRYYRLAADVALLRLNALFQEEGTSADELRNRFSVIFNRAVVNAQAARDADEEDYRNWVSLQRVYQSVVPLQIEGAYENAARSYERALALNPRSPALEVGRARLELARGDSQEARGYIAKAIEKKSNYTDAIFLLSQIQINEGEIDEAIASVEAAAFIDQSNPVAFFQLGLLRYSQDNNEGAIAALERAVSLNADYSNARYFLGLAYNRGGRVNDAILQFERIEELNSDNEEVKLILSNLRQGNEPFANTEPPLDDDIESRESLPIEGE